MTAGSGQESGGSKGDSRHARRRIAEIAGWVVLVAILWTVDTTTQLAELRQDGVEVDSTRLIVGQVSSAFGALLMIPFVVYWLRLFPLRRDRWVAAVIGHSAGSVFFAFGHFALQLLIRGAWFAARDLPFIWREPFVANLLVEYQKDIKIYLGIVLIVTLYRRFGAAPAADEVSGEPAADPGRPGAAEPRRLVVQTGSGEAILRQDEITCLSAARNYVSIYTKEHEYVLRSPLAELEARLADGPFLRVHRSHVVNLDALAEIRTVDGNAEAVLKDGRRVPVSRQRLASLRELGR